MKLGITDWVGCSRSPWRCTIQAHPSLKLQVDWRCSGLAGRGWVPWRGGWVSTPHNSTWAGACLCLFHFPCCTLSPGLVPGNSGSGQFPGSLSGTGNLHTNTTDTFFLEQSWLSFSDCLSGCPVPAQLFCPGCLFPVPLSLAPLPRCPVIAVIFWLSCPKSLSRCPVSPDLYWLPCYPILGCRLHDCPDCTLTSLLYDHSWILSKVNPSKYFMCRNLMLLKVNGLSLGLVRINKSCIEIKTNVYFWGQCLRI